jgi:hypothetical protein
MAVANITSSIFGTANTITLTVKVGDQVYEKVVKIQ